VRSAWLAVPMATIAMVAVLTGPAATASALTGGAPTPSGAAPLPPSRSGAPDPAPSGGNLSLVSATTSPRKSFYYGVRNPRLSYSVGSDLPSNDLRIDVVGESGETVRSFYRNDIAPGVPDSVRWDGTGIGGRPAPNGRYSFRIVPQAGGPAAHAASRGASPSDSATATSLSFDLYGYAFPVLGTHDFGEGGARFGAGRSGHTHQGHDVMANCGVPIVAARGGRVRYSGYQSAAGNYVVIDGRGTGFDTAYMHLLEPSPLQAGEAVRTGQPIGVVGSTGSSTACHLHFEMWTAPGWYEGGSPIDPLSYLLKWDRYS
jgi:murein DD-endopeptidase MepM/ murein hydrolase activator NlpD